MSFWEKMKNSFRRFMTGRSGADELSFSMVILALVLMLIASMLGSVVINLISLVLYGLCIFRMFSRNTSKRYAENQRYLVARGKLKTSASQSWVRLKNMRKYKYFKCPECHALLRLPRKVGEVTVTCGKCHHAFKKKA